MSSSAQEIQSDYWKRISRVFQYIDDHLDTPLSLAILAEKAAFSPYHFHRIFKALTQETPNEYITRRRVEKAALDLLHSTKTISEISHTFGFSDNSSFTRTFKKFYGLNPSVFRKQHPQKFSKIRQLERKNGQTYPDFEQYFWTINNLKNWIKMNANITVEQLPAMELAYVSAIGSGNIATAYQKLMQWAIPKGLMDERAKLITLYHDSFKVTEPGKVRISACLTLGQPIQVEGEIGLTSIPGGKHIMGRFEIGLEEFEQAWTGLFIWMNENGYTKADHNPFEVYHNNFNEHSEKKAIVDFCIPIE